MYRFLQIFTVVAAMLCGYAVQAQVQQQGNINAEEEWEQLADELLDDEDITDYESWWQKLEETKLNPLNLNTVSFDSLKMLGLLSERQIENILQFRKDYGGFMHVNELLLVNGIGLK